MKNVEANNVEFDTQLLSASRDEMYRSLELFLSHVKYTVSLMFTLMTAVFAIFAVALKGDITPSSYMPLVKTLGGTILMLLFPLSGLSIVIISRYYRMYCASLFFAAELHEKAGVPLHLYLKEVALLRKSESENEDALRQVVNKRARQWPRSWTLYAVLIGIVGLAGFVCGIIVLSGIREIAP